MAKGKRPPRRNSRFCWVCGKRIWLFSWSTQRLANGQWVCIDHRIGTKEYSLKYNPRKVSYPWERQPGPKALETWRKLGVKPTGSKKKYKKKRPSRDKRYRNRR